MIFFNYEEKRDKSKKWSAYGNDWCTDEKALEKSNPLSNALGLLFNTIVEKRNKLTFVVRPCKCHASYRSS
jgi:hypothetical protein